MLFLALNVLGINAEPEPKKASDSSTQNEDDEEKPYDDLVEDGNDVDTDTETLDATIDLDDDDATVERDVESEKETVSCTTCCGKPNG